MENEEKKIKYKIIFSDLDQTLLINNHIPDFNLEAIQKARKLGVKFVICTGRNFNRISHLLKELNIEDSENEFTICCSGSKIYENKNQKLIYVKIIPFETVNEIFELGKKFSEIFLLFDTPDGTYIYNETIFKKERKNWKDYNYKIINNLEDIKNVNIIRVIYSNNNYDYLFKIQDEIKKTKIFENKIDYFLSDNRFLEFNAFNVNKGEALKWLCNYLNIDVKESIAIGDSYNDVSMIKEAGLGVCVKSANDDIKKISKYICENDYYEGSVKEIIEKFILY